MAVIRYLVACFFMICISLIAFGQRSDITRKNNKIKNYNNVKFRKNKKMAIICPIFHLSEYPYQGIGFKIGDPFAITYKFYASKNFAVGIDFGKAASGLYSNLHKDRFENAFQPEGDTVFLYQGHSVLNQNVFSAKVFYYKEGPRALKGLDIYVGVGWQVQFVDVKYDYLKIRTVPPETIRTAQTTLFFQPMGPEFVFGLEYANFNFPISAFLEGGLFYNLDQAQQWRRFQGGIGIRYVF